MASTTYVDNVGPPLVAAWLNDVNKATYTYGGATRPSFGNNSARVAQRQASTSGVWQITTSRSVGTVDNCAFWISGGALGGGGYLTQHNPAVASNWTASFGTNLMTVTGAPTSGSIQVGMVITAAGVASGTTILSQTNSTLWTLSTSPGTIGAETVSGGSSALCGSTGFAARCSNLTLSGAGVLSFAVRMEARDAKRYINKNCSFQISVDHDVGSNINYTIVAKSLTLGDDYFASGLSTISTSSPISVPTATGSLLTFANIAMGSCGMGIEFEIQVACGTNSAKNYNFADWSLDIGAIAPQFIANSYEFDLAMCQRYLAAFSMFAASSVYGSGQIFSATQAILVLPFPVPLRTFNAALDAQTANKFTVATAAGNFTGSAVALTLGNTSTNFGAINMTIVGATAGQACLFVSAAVNTWIYFTGAELF